MVGFGVLAMTTVALVLIARPIAADHAGRPTGQLDAADVARGARPAVHRVGTDGCWGSMTGSGFVIDDGRLVTNRHLVDGARSAAVAGETVPVVAVDEAHDLALGRFGDGPALSLSAANAAVGTPVVLAGWVGDEYRWLDGRVHLYGPGPSYGTLGTVMLVEPQTALGFSGGPVLDRRGQVVGVLYGFDRTTELSLAIPVSTVRSWLENKPNGGPTTSCID